MTEPEALRQAWADPDSYATTLLALFIDKYVLHDDPAEKDKAWHWAPETIIAEVYSDYGVDISDHNINKLMAALTIVTTDLFFKDERCFVTLVNVLCGNGFRPAEFEPAEIAECAWGLTEGLILSPPQEPEPFCAAIRRYLGHELKREGFLKPPDILRLAIGTDDANRVAASWHDEPGFAAELGRGQAQKNREVAEVIHDGLTELLGQLQALPLRNGNAKELAERVRRDIKGPATGS